MNVKRNLIYLIFLAPFTWGTHVFAQNTGGGGGGSGQLSQIGVFTGRILPKSIDGASEIFSLSGLRYSHPMSKSGFIDGGAIFGNGEGVKWQGVFLSMSMHIPIETLIGHAGIGLDMTRYEVGGGQAKNIGGGHFIGGIMTRLGGNVLARFDMKLNSKPGTSLFFGIGFVIEFDWGGGGSDSGG